MTKEITLKTYDINKPNEMANMANVLKGHVARHKLYTEIKGKAHVHIEGWQFAGAMVGLTPRIVKTEKLAGDTIEWTDEEGKKNSRTEYKWCAEANIYNKDGEVVGSGIALCSNKEAKKRSFDEYAVLSMAQTRAIGKAYRNLLGWVMKMSGYESTPAEEVSKETVESEATKENEFEKAVKMVEATTSIAVLIEYDTKMKKGKKFTDEQKERLSAIIKQKVNELETTSKS